VLIFSESAAIFARPRAAAPKLAGNIAAPKLIVQNGTMLEGRCSMTFSISKL
jgi:cytoskeletal protein CcmA (bactofilin family)